MNANISEDQIEIFHEFVLECTELLDRLEPEIVDLGADFQDGEFELTDAARDLINEIFRLFHSIKGGGGFLALDNISFTAHAAENLLDEVRKGSITLTYDHIDLFCKTCDFVRSALDFVAENLNDAGVKEQAEALSSVLKAAVQGNVPGTTAAVQVKPASAETAVGDSDFPIPEDPPELELVITPEMRERFIQEADEQLQLVEQHLLKWSDVPGNLGTVGELFRQIHSFKGNCGFMGFADLEQLSHRMETVLDAVKSGTDMGKAKPAEALLNLLDILKEGIVDISNNGSGKIEGLDLYIELLEDLLPRDWTQEGKPREVPRVGEILVGDGVITQETLYDALAVQQKPVGEILVDMGTASAQQVDKALEEQEKIRRQAGASSSGIQSSPVASRLKRQDIRVDLEKLDNLINLIGEMVIAENMLIHSPDLEGMELENFQKSAQQMGKLVKELQEVAMTIRMIPVAGLFRRMTRLVHDLSRKSGKKVDLQLIGMETELDKTVIETITDPLVHLIRNSMDHGLETPEERSKDGKAETGVLKLAASHEEGEVWIKIEDDGRGLNREKIIKKAIARGLIEGDGSQLDEHEVAGLIFLPGFSTADKVTDVSGRGVGMDVVKQNLTGINGKIDVDSRPGAGTRTVLRIPLTMAIIDGMLIRVGNARYILPILSIRESFRPNHESVTVAPDGQELVRIRERLYPVVRLHELHKIPSCVTDLHDGILILLEDQEKSICLFVDEILGQQQTVVKGLSDYLGEMGNAKGVFGCTILGNGDVCLILDAGALMETANGEKNDE